MTAVRKSGLFLVLAGAMLTCICTGSAFADAPLSHALNITVLDGNQNPLNESTVEIWGKDTPSFAVLTNGDGTHYSEVGGGFVWVQVSDPNQGTDTIGMQLRRGLIDLNIDVTLNNSVASSEISYGPGVFANTFHLWGGEGGDGSGTNDCGDCDLDEGEGCGNDTNGGCNSSPPAFTEVDCSGGSVTFCGTAWAEGGTRDTDWYRFTTTETLDISASASSEFAGVLFVVGGIPACAPVVLGSTGAPGPGCATSSASATNLPASDYVIFVATGSFDGDPCAQGTNDYVVTIDVCASGPPTGACCLEDGTCVDDTTEEECASLGGAYQGDGTTCSGGFIGYVVEDCGDAFEDISGTGTIAPTASGSDDNGDVVPIGFTFNFFGDDHAFIGIASNGYLTFGADLSDFTNDPIPSGTDPNDAIFPAWDDWSPNQQGDVYFETKAGPTRFIAQWQDVIHFGGCCTATFQAILFEDGCIDFRYGTPYTTDSDTIGVENQDGSDGTDAGSNTHVPGDCVHICPLTEPPLDCPTNPTAECPDGPIVVSAEFPVSVDFSGSDPDANEVVSLSVTITPDPPTAPTITTNDGNPATGNLSWTPTVDDIGEYEVCVTATDEEGNEDTCCFNLEVAECYALVAGDSGNDFYNNGHSWPTYLSGIHTDIPVLMEEPGVFTLTFPNQGTQVFGSGRGANGFGGTPNVPVRVYAQVVMWNPVVFPNNPEQWTEGVEITVYPNGNSVSRLYGQPDGMHIQTEITRNPDGTVTVRLPFEIEGL